MIPSIDRLRVPLSSVPLHARRGLLGVVLGLGLLAGCSGFSSEEKPLPDSTFTQVLTELQVATVRQSQGIAPSPSFRDSIFAHYNVDSSAFEATLRYYSRHPKAFQSLYQSIIDTLQAQQYSNRGRTMPEGAPDSLAEDKRREESSQ